MRSSGLRGSCAYAASASTLAVSLPAIGAKKAKKRPSRTSIVASTSGALGSVTGTSISCLRSPPLLRAAPSTLATLGLSGLRSDGPKGCAAPSPSSSTCIDMQRTCHRMRMHMCIYMGCTFDGPSSSTMYCLLGAS